MAKITKPLSDTQCESAKPKEKDYRLYDGHGLSLLVRKSGTKTWQFRYKRLEDKKEDTITIGDYSKARVKGVIISLSEAKEKRKLYLQNLENGIDPKQFLKDEETKVKGRLNFETVARDWHNAYIRTGKADEGTVHKSLRSFEMYVFPIIGEKAIDEIETRDLRRVIKSIENELIAKYGRIGKDGVLGKINSRFKPIFAYAKSEGYINSNPAYDLDDKLGIKTQEKHYPKLKLELLPEFQQRLEVDNSEPLTKLIIKFALHTFARSSELRFARWEEIDYEKRAWLIPPKRTFVKGCLYSDRGAKMKKWHIIPLSTQALKILEEIKNLSGASNHIFPHETDFTKFMGDSTVNNALRRMGYDTEEDVCLHGFRGTAQGALELSRLFAKDAIERQMSHKGEDSVRWAYTEHIEFLEERTQMMQWWSNYIELNRYKYMKPEEYRQQLIDDASNNIFDLKLGKLIAVEMLKQNF